MVSVGIDKETGNKIEGFLVKEEETERAFIIPKDGLKIINGKPVVKKIREIEIMSEKSMTPYWDATGYPICVGDTLQIKTGQEGTVSVTEEGDVVFVIEDIDGSERFCYITLMWIVNTGAQVTKDKYTGSIKSFEKGYAREF